MSDIVIGTPKCMISGCMRPRARRGLCLICYSNAKARVDSGVVTWDKLVEIGLCESNRSPFDDAFDRAIEESKDAKTSVRNNQRDMEGR